MEISLIQPSRNTLKYLKWSYDSIRKNQGNHVVEICVADDNSNDGTWEWCQERMKDDPNFKAIRNDSGERVGHTILYDKLIGEVATKDICMIFHSDMYLAEGALDSIEKYIEPKTIVSLTRIEPPLHVDGPEKVLQDFGTEPELFVENSFEVFAKQKIKEFGGKTTTGIFAPWAFYKSDFQEINGHDPLYKPQSKEDSDIFDRFQLNGCKFIQVWDGFVYHMTCRGSRFNPTLTKVGTNSDEWNAQNIKSARNFTRKWGRMVEHDNYLNPIVPPRYKKSLTLTETTNIPDRDLIIFLTTVEPWFDNINISGVDYLIEDYIKFEQKNTLYDLSKKFNKGRLDVDVECKVRSLGDTEFKYIQMLPKIIQESGEPNGEFELGNLLIRTKDLTDHNNELILVDKSENLR